MKKQEFLSGLEQALSVLEEEELRDIISEYEQHIDMKVKRGLTEEEAIADFGSFQELTSQLLEAYHVRADYALNLGGAGGKSGLKQESQTGGFETAEGRRTAGQRRDAEQADPENQLGRDYSSREKTMGKALKELGSKGGRGLWNGMKKAAFFIGTGLGWLRKQVCRPFAWAWRQWEQRSLQEESLAETEIQDQMAEGETGNLQSELYRGAGPEARDRRNRKGQRTEGRSGMGSGMEGSVRESGMITAGIKTVWKMIRTACHWVKEIVLLGILGVWNGCWFLFMLFAAGAGLFSLFFMGVLAILLMEGYPLVGVTVGCTGLSLCMFSAAGLGRTMLLPVKREGGKKRRDEAVLSQEIRPDHKGSERRAYKEEAGASVRKEAGQDA